MESRLPSCFSTRNEATGGVVVYPIKKRATTIEHIVGNRHSIFYSKWNGNRVLSLFEFREILIDSIFLDVHKCHKQPCGYWKKKYEKDGIRERFL
jgi:hypothetical protein